MMGFASPLSHLGAPQATQPLPAQPPPQPQAPPQQPTPAPPQAQPIPANMKTMLGFASPFAAQQQPPQAQPQPQPPQQQQPPPQQQVPPRANPQGMKTMLGVATPGIAPLHASAPQQPVPPPQPIPQAPKALGGTMLGVAVPGIAPLHSSPGAPPVQHQPPPPAIVYEPPPPIVPAPAPFIHEAAPSKPNVVVHKRGAPIAIVAVIGSLVVLAGGVVLLVLSRGAPPLTASAKVSAEGKEQLHLRCESCPDGTTASSQGAKATFANKEADIDLPAALAIGDNTFQIALDRPNMGRDETVKLVLPLAYRIRGDLSSLSGDKPAINVVVEAQAGTTVTVDGKPVTLDSSGKATLGYDVTQETTGATDETRTIEKKIPYSIVDKDKKKSDGEVAVRVAVMPLHVDAPGTSLVTADPSAWISGRTAKGSTVTANGKPLTVAADGAFEGQVDLQDGAQSITVRASAADDGKTVKAAPRTATVQVKRVASIDAEAKELDAAALGFDDASRDPATNAGKPLAATGVVLEARAGHHQTVLLVDDKRGCAKGPCMVRVEHGADDGMRAGDAIVAYGVVGKPFTTPDGKTLLVLDASLVKKGAKK
jgi:hypothetical protein